MDNQIKQDIKNIMHKAFRLDISIDDIDNVSFCEGNEYQLCILRF